MAKKFVDMYYGILNNSHELMYRFYRAGSTVTVSEALENGTTVTETADTEEVSLPVGLEGQGSLLDQSSSRVE